MSLLKKSWFISLCFFLLVKPNCISSIPTLYPLDVLLNALRVLLVLYVLIVFFKDMLVLPINRLLATFLLVVASMFWELIATALNDASVADFGALTNSLGIALICYMGLRSSYSSFVEGLAKITSLYVIINCLTVLMFPSGMYSSSSYTQNYFLGYRAAWLPIYLLALTSVLLWNSNCPTQHTKFWALAVIFSMTLSMIIQWTATGLFCFSTAGAIFYLFSKKHLKPIKIQWILIIEAIFFYIIIISRSMETFSFILVNILKKDLTLTFRTRIWDNAVAAITSNSLIGVGRLSAVEMQSILGFGVTHPHNHYLYITLCYGLIGLSLFLMTVFLSNVGKTRSADLRPGQIMMFAYIVLLSAAQVESFSATGGYILPIHFLAASLHCKRLSK